MTAAADSEAAADAGIAVTSEDAASASVTAEDVSPEASETAFSAADEEADGTAGVAGAEDTDEESSGKPPAGAAEEVAGVVTGANAELAVSDSPDETETTEDLPPSEEAGRGTLLSPEALVPAGAGEKFREPETSGKTLPAEGFEELFPPLEDTGDDVGVCSVRAAAEVGEDACPAPETSLFAPEDSSSGLIFRVSVAEVAAGEEEALCDSSARR